MALNIVEVSLDPVDNTKTIWGDPVASRHHLAYINGTSTGEVFALTDLSSAVRTLMDSMQRGAYVEMGGGSDTASGTAYGDAFVMGAGTDYIDGGANGGTTIWGGRANDTLDVFATSQVAANAVTVNALDGTGSATDIAAHGNGYTHKVVNGADVTYIKGIEHVNVQLWMDANSNGVRDWGSEPISFARNFTLAVNIDEIKVDPNDATKTTWGDPIAGRHHLAYVSGTAGGDTFNAATDLSLESRTLMDNQQRGVYVELRGGNDTAIGTAYGDGFVMGPGTDHVDGGANGGTTVFGGRANDTLDVFVASQAAANAVTVTALDGTGTAADISAHGSGYTGKVVNGADITYIKNIENVNVSIWTDANGNGQRDFGSESITFARNIAMAVNIDEVKVDPNDATKTTWGDPIAGRHHLAYVNGTAAGETFNATTDLSAESQSLMVSKQRGVYVEMRGGNDTATGTAYGDGFVMGAGTDYVDGSANTGTTVWGGRANDTLDVFVANQAAANAVTVTSLDGTGSATDISAHGNGYTHKAVNGADVTYLKGIEHVNVQVWTDTNGNDQRDWGSESIVFARNIALAVSIDEVKADPNDATRTVWGDPIANRHHLAYVHGTGAGETFNAGVDLSAESQTLMDSKQKGVYVELRGGNDTAIGTAYGDGFVMGAGTDHVDGGANNGTTVWGGRANDTLDVFVANQSAANAVTVTALDGTGTAADISAHGSGYTGKVVNGADVTYIKGIEHVNVQIWTDSNGNGQRDWGSDSITFARNIALAVNIDEVKVDPNDATKTVWGDPIAGRHHLAYINGSAAGETFNASSDLSAESLALIASKQRGVYVDMRGGNDTAIGTAYGDGFVMGAGTDHVDGGANNGTTVWGGRANDTLDVFVANQSAANAVTVTALDGTGTAADISAHGSGYTGKVVNGADVTYIKGIEHVNVQIWTDSNGNGQRDWGSDSITFARNIALAVNIDEVKVDPNDATKTVWGDPIAGRHHLAYINGSSAGETFTAATDLSAESLSLMASKQRGVYVDMRGGNDTAVGTGYGDGFVMGAGTDHVDGGAHAGTNVFGGRANDTLDVYVANQTAANAVTVTGLDGTGAAADVSAHGNGYTHKVVNGADVTYIKNIENVNVQIWTDANGNGQRDYGSESITFARNIALAVNIDEVKVDPNDATKTVWGDPIAGRHHLAYINGTGAGESFTAGTDLSAESLALIASKQRGVYVDMRGGNDTAVGTGYGDGFVMGAGTDHVDGGAHAGTNVFGGRANDTLDVYVANQTAANAVTVTGLDGTGAAADVSAHGNGYTHKVVNGADVTYIKNIENVNVQIWTDANGNGQRDYGSESITFARNIALALNIDEIKLDPNDATKTTWGDPIAGRHHLAYINGTGAGESFNAGTDLSAESQSLIASKQRGVYVDMAGGNDTAVGTAYGDGFVMSAGTDYVDGAAHGGTTVFGGRASDTLDIYVASQAAANAVTVSSLDGSGSATDSAAHGNGYTHKVVNGADVTYLKNIEHVNVQIWTDPNGNGMRDEPMTYARGIALAMSIDETKLDPNDPTKTIWGDPIASRHHLAHVNGTSSAETFDPAADLSAESLALIASKQRGVYVDLAGGNDTAIGTAYGDGFVMGAGTDYIDGGAHGGTTVFGGPANDVLDVYVADQAGANAVAVTLLDGTGTATDVAAHGNGYTAKVVNGAAVTYAKNIEHVNVQIWTDGNGNGMRDEPISVARSIPLALSVNEIMVDPNDSSKTLDGQPLANQFHFAWANGTSAGDSFSVAANVSATTRARMDTHQRGVSVELGAGNDTAVGSAYGDNFVMGAGTDHVDGGTNLGTFNGNAATDQLDIYVANAAEADALSLTVLNGSSTGADATAFANGYTSRISGGDGRVTYLKDIEAINVQIWNDLDGDGLRDYPGELTAHSYDRLVPGVFTNTGDLTTQFHMGSVNGTLFDDQLNLASGSALIPTTLANNIATYGRGLFVQAGEGNDTITGTAYGDGINAGVGTNYVDGGANQGMTPATPTANPGRDSLDVFVTNTTDAAAVTLEQLTAGASGQDLTAFQNGYAYKVTSAASGETDYVKNVETLNVRVWTDLNGNGNNDFGSEVATYRTRALGMTVTDNAPATTNQTPSQGFIFGTHFTDTLNGADSFTLMNETFNASNAFGSFIFALGGDDTVVGTDGTDFTVATQYGSKLVDGGADAGYYYYGSGTSPSVSADTYRMLEQRTSAEVPNSGVANGGMTTANFSSAKYRLVDLTKWTDYATTSLDQMTSAATSSLTNRLTSSAIDATDASAIATTAGQLGLTGAGGNGYSLALVKYDGVGALIGVDFLKNVETVQLGLWYDFNRNDVANGGASPETVIWNTFSMATDSYVLNDGQTTLLNATAAGMARSYAGVVSGSSQADVLDASAISLPGYIAAGTGFRVGDANGNDTVTGSSGADLFAIGVGNDSINGGGGTDSAAVFWKPDTTKGTASLSSTTTTDAGVTTIAVSQTQQSVTTELFRLVGSGNSWTFSTSSSAADLLIRPFSTSNTALTLGTDQLTDVEYLSVYLEAAVAIDTVGVTTTNPFEIQMII